MADGQYRLRTPRDMRSLYRGGKAGVIGDGAVGLCGVIAARRLGAEPIIILGRHPDRIALAKAFGATDVVSERGEEAMEHVRKLTGAKG
jgi:threonine dehydrogenase-like Zn-dependent dehydrogenase